MIKFVLAAAWICVATIGSVFYAFQASGAKPSDQAASAPTMMGGLDYVKTDVISVPFIRDSVVKGYFLARLVYTVDPAEMRKLTVPAEAIITDAVYSYIYAMPPLDLSKKQALDLDAFRKGVRDSINERVKEDLIQDVLIEQVDYLTKDEVRANSPKPRMPVNVKSTGLGSDGLPASATPAPAH